MAHETGSPAEDRLREDFELGGWRVRPSLNRLERDGSTVRLEPKMIDVLSVLAHHAGRVVSKDELSSAVWPDVFVTEAVITRAIAGLRRALDDDARSPRFIETIAKRGYRLMVAPRRVAGGAGGEPAGWVAGGIAGSRPPPRGPAVAGFAGCPSPHGATAPWSPGQWVRGGRFFGRGAEIAEILDGSRNALWLLGSRAIGKTSTLRHLEHLCAGGERGFFPLFWDLQGSDDPDHLDRDFAEALADAAERLEAAGVAPGEVAGGGFLAALGRLRRALAARGSTLLLLVDEAEELLALQRSSPPLLRKLRRALQSADGIRAVLAASSRLWQLSDGDQDTSPFLHGFAPPVYLGCLDDEAARRVLAGGGFEPATAAGILDLSGGHPFLLQLLAVHCSELGDLGRAAEAVAADAAVHRFFAVDLDLLSPPERELALALAVERPAEAGDGPDPAAALHLERLGVLRRRPDGRLGVRSPILRRWLAVRAGQNE
jgi:DNA-binding winged helix-turn-helix (wHTH) protein